jgi:biopolymer transport protein ExbB
MSLGELLSKGGWAMLPIYACSVIGLAVFLKKALDLRGARISDLGWLDGVLDAVRQGDLERAGSACARVEHPVSRVLTATLSAMLLSPQRAEAEAVRVGSLEVQRLERHLGVLSFIAQAAPLLGLLGTVLGMVDLFIGLEGAGLATVDVGRLSSGIWKALLTTAAGLLVAVPTLAAYTYLLSRTDQLRLQMRDAVERLLTARVTAGESPEQ